MPKATFDGDLQKIIEEMPPQIQAIYSRPPQANAPKRPILTKATHSDEEGLSVSTASSTQSPEQQEEKPIIGPMPQPSGVASPAGAEQKSPPALPPRLHHPEQ